MNNVLWCPTYGNECKSSDDGVQIESHYLGVPYDVGFSSPRYRENEQNIYEE